MTDPRAHHNGLNGLKQKQSAWTPEQLAILEIRVKEGFAASVIGAELGKSRNSVISRCHRSGFQLGQTRRTVSTATVRKSKSTLTGTRKYKPKNTPIAIPIQLLAKKRRVRLTTADTPFVIPPRPETNLSEGSTNLILKIPGSMRCRYIFGDVKKGEAFWCGKPTHKNTSWCKECHGRVYDRTSNKNKRVSKN